jgi:hypothetical protein
LLRRIAPDVKVAAVSVDTDPSRLMCQRAYATVRHCVALGEARRDGPVEKLVI